MTEQELQTACAEFAAAFARFAAALLSSQGGAAQKQAYTIDEAAQLLGVTRALVQAKIRAGAFGETINLNKRNRLITAAGMQQYLDSSTGPAYRPKEYRSRRREPLPAGNPGPI